MAFTNRMFQLITPFLEEIQELEDMWDELRLQRSLNSAVGAQLDGLGEIVVLPRVPSTKDDFDYRKEIEAKILVNSGYGVPEVVIKFTETLTASTDLEYREVYPAGIKMYVNGDDKVVFGSHDGADNAAILSDSSKTFIADGLIKIGQKIFNLTDGSVADITSFTETTITGALSGGEDNDWDTNDLYDIPIIPYASSIRQLVEPTMPSGVKLRSIIYLNSALTIFNQSEFPSPVTDGLGFFELGYPEFNGYTAGAYSELF